MRTKLVGPSLALAMVSQAAIAQPAPPPAPPPPSSGQQDGERPAAASPPPPRSARFRVEAGDIRLGMTCPEEETMKACADVALQLLVKAASVASRRQ